MNMNSQQKMGENIQYSGYLHAPRGVFKFWKRLYCVISENNFIEYSQKIGKENFRIPIDKFCQIKTFSVHRRPYCFTITNGSQSISYQVKTKNERNDWVDKINAIINETISQENKIPVTLNDFEIIKVIGRGYFGKVSLVRFKRNNKLYALKSMSKAKLVQYNYVDQILNERQVLIQNNHPFLVSAHYAFQTDSKIFIVLDYVPGGELFERLRKENCFSERRTKFYVTEVILGLEHLHKNGVIYRDIKPENILIDEDGHIKITDFGFAKPNMKTFTDTTTTFCGTPIYLAPEICRMQPYTRSVDWWELGVFMYELLTGEPPFFNRNPERVQQNIINKPVKCPDYLSKEVVDLISKLLEKNPLKRLGAGPDDAEEIKRHPFFQDISWDDVLHKRVKPMWKPTIYYQTDTSNFDKEFTQEPTGVSLEDPDLVPTETQEAFEGFTCVAEDTNVID
ncbi:AGC family protein kinase [Histomonas meleagridis]|uniref:AGC family protein kinase n=1 Tax=Histomonas meleagridis TaxID=135588 RepID=UPI0035597CB6|nr:AGC family protein kinase [Histomonas meleagridis]KAH0798320.1 AGC family protein kinase [Histomonas meleagridis]